MVFGIEEIGDEGLCFSLALKKDQLEIDQAGLNVNVDITINGSLTRIDDDVYLKGTVITCVVASCSRCLDTISYPIDSDLKSHFVPSDDSLHHREMWNCMRLILIRRYTKINKLISLNRSEIVYYSRFPLYVCVRKTAKAFVSSVERT